jgi:hypothetical protein
MSYGLSATPTICRYSGDALLRVPTKPLARSISLDSREEGTDSVSGASSDRSDNPAFIPEIIEDVSTFDIAGDAGRGYVMLSAFAKPALARRSKHPKGLKCRHTFRIGAPVVNTPRGGQPRQSGNMG